MNGRVPPDPARQATAEDFNQISQQVVALAGLASVAILSVHWNGSAYQAVSLATLIPGPARLRNDLARRAMYGMSRVFLGDDAADSLGIPAGTAKHVVRAVAPGLRLADRARLRILGPERVTARGYAERERELARLKAEHAMTHDLVDAVPGAVGRPQ